MIIVENKIPAEDYIRLRQNEGWKEIHPKQAENAVNNCFYSVCLKDDDKVIGMARVHYQGDYDAYITDVIVDKDYQGKGYGKIMMENIIEYMKNNTEEGFKIRLILLAAKDKEGFYEKFGFKERPSKKHGPGMYVWIK